MRFVALLLVVAIGCSKSDDKAAAPAAGEKAGSAESGARRVAKPVKMSDVTMADVVEKTIAEGTRGPAAPAAPPAPPPPAPVDPLPPEEPKPPEPIAPAPVAPAADELKVGDRVNAQWTNGRWYPGKIVAIKDGKYDVNYDDGDKSRGLPASKVKKRKAGGGGSVAGKSSSSSDAPCPGPGLTRRCNGRCVNIQEDNNHCGGCNNRCPDGKRCDGHMFCRDAAGNL